jgi:hypothetical protein
MKKVLLAVALFMVAGAAYAACTTHTYFVNGKMVMCQTCCYGTNCTTTCY